MKISILLTIFFILSSCNSVNQGNSVFSQGQATGNSIFAQTTEDNIVGVYKANYNKQPYTLMIKRISTDAEGGAFGFFGFFDRNKAKIYQAINAQNNITMVQAKQNVCNTFHERCSDELKSKEPLCRFKTYGIFVNLSLKNPSLRLGILFATLKDYPGLKIGNKYQNISGKEYVTGDFKFNNNQLTVTFKETGYIQLFRRKHFVFKKTSDTVSENNFVKYLNNYNTLSQFFREKEGNDYCLSK